MALGQVFTNREVHSFRFWRGSLRSEENIYISPTIEAFIELSKHQFPMLLISSSTTATRDTELINTALTSLNRIHMGESKRKANFKSWILGFIISLFICLASIAVINRVVNKVVTGHGLDYYITFEGFQFNYLGALILICVMFVLLITIPLIHHFDPLNKEEKDFKKKYDIQDN